jgi:uncharacterized DUF497 family protein
VDFEWDDAKNKANIRKHGLDFTNAREIFDAPMLAEIDNSEDYGEKRFVGIGFLRNIIVVIIFTEPRSETIRVISLRKALKYEREKFEQSIGNRLDET